MGTLFLYKLGRKIVIFRGFSNWIPIKVININRILKHISLLTAQSKMWVKQLFHAGQLGTEIFQVAKFIEP